MDRDHRAGRLSGRDRGGRLAAESRQVCGCQVEPERPREVEHVVDDAVQPVHLLVDVGSRLAQLRRAACRDRASAARP